MVKFGGIFGSKKDVSDEVKMMVGKNQIERKEIAGNGKTPVKILEELALDCREIRYAVLMNRNAPIDLVRRLKLENEREDAEKKREEHDKNMKRAFPG